jgi:glycine cleavage system regulatory protein
MKTSGSSTLEVVLCAVQENRSAAEAANVDAQQKLQKLSEGVAEGSQQCGTLQSRVATLRDEFVALLAAESEARGDSATSLRASLQSGLQQERFELNKLAEAVQVCPLQLSRSLSVLDAAGIM